MKPIIIIPARLASTRLPNKPLADIAGKPMIVRVLEQAKKSGIMDVYVACAEQEIADVVEKFGGKSVLTDPDHPSGTDRIYEAIQKIGGEFDIVINVQGDLPLLDPVIINDLLDVLNNDQVDIATLAAKIEDEQEKTNPNVVKAVISFYEENKGKALYFTRSTAPYGQGDLFHHIGIYGFKRKSLEKFVELLPSELEKREKLEQLRALENNMRIDVGITSVVPLGVDTVEDLEKVRNLIKEKV